MSLTINDYQLIATSSLFIFLGFAHIIFGRKAYVEGSNMGIFRKNGNWTPDSAKELTLLGVFYMIAFSWWESQILIIIAIITENPISIWIVSISIFFELAQVILLRKYVSWNYEAIGVVLVHVVSQVIWLIPVFTA